MALMSLPFSMTSQDTQAPVRGTRGYQPQPSYRPSAYAEKRNDAVSVVERRMPVYVEALQLDDFKAEIVKTNLFDYHSKREVLETDYNIKFAEKQDAYLALEDELHKNLESILSTEELAEFKKVQFLDEKQEKKKRRKKKKKDKKNKKVKKKQLL